MALKPEVMAAKNAALPSQVLIIYDRKLEIKKALSHSGYSSCLSVFFLSVFFKIA